MRLYTDVSYVYVLIMQVYVMLFTALPAQSYLTYLTYADIVCSDILIASASSHFVYYLPPRRSILGDIKGLVQGDVRFIQIFLQAFHPCHSLSTSGLLCVCVDGII